MGVNGVVNQKIIFEFFFCLEVSKCSFSIHVEM